MSAIAGTVPLYSAGSPSGRSVSPTGSAHTDMSAATSISSTHSVLNPRPVQREDAYGMKDAEQFKSVQGEIDKVHLREKFHAEAEQRIKLVDTARAVASDPVGRDFLGSLVKLLDEDPILAKRLLKTALADDE